LSVYTFFSPLLHFLQTGKRRTAEPPLFALCTAFRREEPKLSRSCAYCIGIVPHHSVIAMFCETHNSFTTMQRETIESLMVAAARTNNLGVECLCLGKLSGALAKFCNALQESKLAFEAEQEEEQEIIDTDSCGNPFNETKTARTSSIHYKTKNHCFASHLQMRITIISRRRAVHPSPSSSTRFESCLQHRKDAISALPLMWIKQYSPPLPSTIWLLYAMKWEDKTTPRPSSLHNEMETRGTLL
jgi:hypothetical protein